MNTNARLVKAHGRSDGLRAPAHVREGLKSPRDCYCLLSLGKGRDSASFVEVLSESQDSDHEIFIKLAYIRN